MKNIAQDKEQAWGWAFRFKLMYQEKVIVQNENKDLFSVFKEK